MKAISLHQPWASAVAFGIKRWETRSWYPNDLPGRIAIHASAKRSRAQLTHFMLCWGNAEIRAAFAKNGFDLSDWDRLPFGSIIATCTVETIASTELIQPSATQSLLGDYSDGRFAWRLENISRLHEPIPCKGRLGLWTIPPNIETEM